MGLSSELVTGNQVVNLASRPESPLPGDNPLFPPGVGRGPLLPSEAREGQRAFLALAAFKVNY